MSSIEISAEQVNVNLEEGTVIITGFGDTEIVTELKDQIGLDGILNELDYADIVEYVAEIERDKRESDE